MKCPSCNCQEEVCSCECTPQVKKPSLIKRTISKWFLSRDSTGCEVALKNPTCGSLAHANGKNVRMADGSTSDPIKLECLQDVKDTINLMGIACDGVIGKFISSSTTPQYVTMDSTGVILSDSVRSDILYAAADIVDSKVGTIATWTVDGTNLKLTKLTPPATGVNPCVTKYYLTFDCEGICAWTTAISTFSDLINGCTNVGALVVYDGTDAKELQLTDLADSSGASFLVCVETDEPVVGDTTCSLLFQKKKTWYKTTDLSNLTYANTPASTVGETCFVNVLCDTGDGINLVEKRLTLAADQVITADTSGNLIVKDIFEVLGINRDLMIQGETRPIDPVNIATTSTTVDVSAFATIPSCMGTLWVILEGYIRSDNNSVSNMKVDGVVIAECGSGTSFPDSSSGVGYHKLPASNILTVEVNSVSGGGITPSLRLLGFICGI